MALNFSWLKTQLLAEAALLVAIAVMRVLKVGSISIRLNKVTDLKKKQSTGSHQSTCTNSSIDRASAVVRDRSMIARSIDGCAIDR